jgi:hypothetical protein
MKFAVLIYNDPDMLGALPTAEFNSSMRDCLAHADEMKAEGTLLATQMLEDPSTAKSIRIRRGRKTILDGPFAETKEILGGFNIIEAESMEEAIRMAEGFPWASTGCVEVRPVRDMDAVRVRVGAVEAARGA